MSPKKQYQTRLPAILPPTQRRPPDTEVRPAEETTGTATPEPVAPPVPSSSAPRARAAAPPPAPTPRPAPTSRPAPTPRPGPTSRPAPAPTPAVRPTAADPDPRPRRAKLAWAAGLALLLGALAALAVVWRVQDDPTPAPVTPATSTSGQGYPEAGTSRTVSEVGPDGDLEVTQWIHTQDPLDTLELALPELGEGTSVEATGVKITADGTAVPGPGTISFTYASYAFDPSTRIRIRYTLSGAVQRSSSATRRGLATVTALDVSAAQPRDIRVVRSEAVFSLACTSDVAVAARPCGDAARDGEWRVLLTGADVGARVLAAVTLPS